MIKKNKKIIILLICILLVIIGITLYAHKITPIMNKNDKIEFDVIKLSNKKEIVYDYDLDNFSKTEYKSYEGEIYNSNKSIYYHLIISSDGKLYIIDETNDKSICLSDYEFEKLFVPDNVPTDSLTAYALSTKHNVYEIKLNEPDIDKTSIELVKTDIDIKDFVNIRESESDVLIINSVYVIDNNGIIYDLMTNSMYSKNMYNFFNEYIIYSDYEISNSNGYLLTNSEGEPFKFLAIVELDNTFNFPNNPKYFIITDDYHIIYSINNDLYISKLYLENDKIIEKDNYSYITFIELSDRKIYNINSKIYSITFSEN